MCQVLIGYVDGLVIVFDFDFIQLWLYVNIQILCWLESMIGRQVRYGMSFTYPCPRKLRQIMKMSLIQKQPQHTIKNIWKQYHEPRVANTSDILTKDQYTHLTNKSNRCPLYILPLHRNNGHFKLLTQWQDNCFLGTYLQDYKRQGRNAHPYIVYTFFTELLFNKGIVLVRGDIVNNSMNKGEAIKIWELVKDSYFSQDKYDMVDQFNNRPQEFSMDNYNKMYSLQ